MPLLSPLTSAFPFRVLAAWIVTRDTMVARTISIEIGMQNEER